MTIKRKFRYFIEPLNRFIGKIIQFVVPYNLFKWVGLLKEYFFSLWISPIFKHVGKGSLIYSGSTIIGSIYIYIGNNTTFCKHAVLTAWDKYGEKRYLPSIKIGNNCNFGEYLHLSCVNSINIGNGVLTGRWVTIVDNGHGISDYKSMSIPPAERVVWSKGPVTIEDDVWIGDKVTILPGVTIGQGSIIGANSVVTKDIPALSVAAGNPAKVIKKIDKQE